MDISTRISDGLVQLDLAASSEQLNLLKACIEQLSKWNKAYNLTAIRESDKMVILHLFDSLSILKKLQPGRLLDVGTGPGFPGIPLAIMDPNREFYLLDSNGKKTRYIKQLIHELGLTNVTVLDTRVEQWQPEQPFDVIVSRAFASLTKMVSLSEHLLAPQGYWQAMKGEFHQEEVNQMPSRVSVISVDPLEVPGLEAERHLITIKKSNN